MTNLPFHKMVNWAEAVCNTVSEQFVVINSTSINLYLITMHCILRTMTVFPWKSTSKCQRHNWVIKTWKILIMYWNNPIVFDPEKSSYAIKCYLIFNLKDAEIEWHFILSPRILPPVPKSLEFLSTTVSDIRTLPCCDVQEIK